MESHVFIHENPPVIKWKEKMSILMVTLIMVGVWLMSIPIVGYFNGKIALNNFTEILVSASIFFTGIFLTYQGLSSSYIIVHFKNQFLIVENQIGFFSFHRKYDLSDSVLFFEQEEDEDGIIWYHLMKENGHQKMYILKSLDYTRYQAIQKFIQ